ncbi:biotin/lipoate A/B protein ligase family protein [Bacteroidota bacterium]
MQILNSQNTNPYFNIATEEYLFKHQAGNFFFLYRNKPSVIIGKHQNTYNEINPDYIFENNTAVIRRLSGGGAVYHDSENINFSFIINKEGKNLVDFKKHIRPFYDLLLQLNVEVTLSKRNDLFIGKNKISGNAEHVVKNRILHHGTILFNTNLKNLKNALNVNSGIYKSRAINSVRNPVDNVSHYLKNSMSIEKFSELMLDKIQNENPGSQAFYLNNVEIKFIENLVDTKYSSWKWNYAYSPDFEFNNSIILNKKSFSIKLKIMKGTIKNVFIETEILTGLESKQLKELLLNEKYYYPILKEKLVNLTLNKNINQAIFGAIFGTI